jgi:hypothetical protein
MHIWLFFFISVMHSWPIRGEPPALAKETFASRARGRPRPAWGRWAGHTCRTFQPRGSSRRLSWTRTRHRQTAHGTTLQESPSSDGGSRESSPRMGLKVGLWVAAPHPAAINQIVTTELSCDEMFSGGPAGDGECLCNFRKVYPIRSPTRQASICTASRAFASSQRQDREQR